ncbi:hypothetical protein N656DRAFT_790666 [Canariomyces notabilis]|uniref:RBR-type E3 ubiquitin transferase n=1 Tax=Canariomyces notabilis TaxID=2074819 RepID=A0AAN6TB94_9PEZI|nr:hypothetical protein N656DRAFT_790666 [Canariomyces arenarius]
MSLGDIDDQTLAVVVQLQLEDLQAIQEAVRAGKRKGKQRLGEVDDAELVLEMYHAELLSAARSLSDRAMCQRILRAVGSDAELIGTSLREEDQAVRDEDIALSISAQGGTRDDGNDHVDSQTSWADSELAEQLETLHLPSMGDCEDPTGQVESSKDCVACGEKHHDTDVAACPCSHDYCRDCLNSLFKASLTDEGLFPPKCCGQEISLEIYRTLVHDKGVAEQFQEKKVEFGTVNRTYCHQATCSAFVPPTSIHKDVATCQRCLNQTCAICKAPAHEGSDCPQDPSLQETLRLAAEQGWQRCSSCKRLVELDHGCNHITCHCGFQFCYVCGERWKTCRCPQWDEGRLYRRANNLVDRDAAGRRLGVQRRADLVERAVHELRANHECRHQEWRYRAGRFRCEECRGAATIVYHSSEVTVMSLRHPFVGLKG